MYDSWLERFYGQRLSEIDTALASGVANPFALFRGLDDDVWTVLLFREYSLYTHILSVLPELPDAKLQEVWTGASGMALARQSKAFYTCLKELYSSHGNRSLQTSKVLDYGCGWGRFIRFLARDVEPGHLFGVDPWDEILQVCSETRVPAVLDRIDELPDRISNDATFDLVFAMSVFTHLSEPAHLKALHAIHHSLRPGGLFVATVRPLEFRSSVDALDEVVEVNRRRWRPDSGYYFAPHNREPVDGEVSFGETIVTLPYVKKHWTSLFELIERRVTTEDPYQVILALRKPAA